MQNTLLTLFLSILFAWDIDSQSLISDWTLSSLYADALFSPQTQLTQQVIHAPLLTTRQYSQKPKIAFYINAGPGISQLYLSRPIYTHTTVKKESWGFSANLGAGVRFRLSSRCDLEFGVNAMQMKSTIEGLIQTTLVIGPGFSSSDTLNILNQTIKANWVNRQFALKFRYQPKRNFPLHIHAGIDLKKQVINHSLHTTYKTEIGELLYNLSGFYTYRRLPTPRMTQSVNDDDDDNYETGVILSLEFAPFQYRLDHLSFELGFNQAITDLEGLRRQRFLFGAAKFTFK